MFASLGGFSDRLLSRGMKLYTNGSHLDFGKMQWLWFRKPVLES